jgi:DNA-binding NarL/FixJ family response regulator
VTGAAEVSGQTAAGRPGEAVPSGSTSTRATNRVTIAVGGFERHALRSQNATATYEARDRVATLTKRQSEVLALLQLGQSNAEIALALHISTETVKTHVARIFDALGVNSRIQLHHVDIPRESPIGG